MAAAQRGRAGHTVIGRWLVRFPWLPRLYVEVIEVKDTEPQTAPDVQFGTLQPRVISVRMGECDTCLNSVIENDCSDVEKKNF